MSARRSATAAPPRSANFARCSGETRRGTSSSSPHPPGANHTNDEEVLIEFTVAAAFTVALHSTNDHTGEREKGRFLFKRITLFLPSSCVILVGCGATANVVRTCRGAGP